MKGVLKVVPAVATMLCLAQSVAHAGFGSTVDPVAVSPAEGDGPTRTMTDDGTGQTHTFEDVEVVNGEVVGCKIDGDDYVYDPDEGHYYQPGIPPNFTYYEFRPVTSGGYTYKKVTQGGQVLVTGTMPD